MQNDLGTQPSNIALASCRGAGVNDGSPKDLTNLFRESRRPLLVTFVNTADPRAKAWLGLLPGLQGPTLNVFAVLFKHDGVSWQTCDHDADALAAVREAAAGKGEAAFQAVPVVIDPDGALAKAFLNGLPSMPAAKDTWSYLIDPAFLICDKWHSSAVSPGYPISFKHIRLSADPGPFNGGDPQNAKAYVMKRAANLLAPLIILAAKPSVGALVHSAPDIRKVIFSKPLLDSTVTADKFSLQGPGLPGGGPLPAVAVSYTGYEKAENGVLLSFPAGPLFKQLGADAVSLVVDNSPGGVLDTARGQLSGPNAVRFATEGISAPMPQPAYVKPVIRDESRKPTGAAQPSKPAVREGSGGLAKPEARKPEPEKPAKKAVKPAKKKAAPKKAKTKKAVPKKAKAKKPAAKKVNAKKAAPKKAKAKKAAPKKVKAKKAAPKKAKAKKAAPKKPAKGKKAAAKKPAKGKKK
jgi:hypothetical protein